MSYQSEQTERINPEHVKLICKQLRQWDVEIPKTIERDLIDEFDVLDDSFQDLSKNKIGRWQRKGPDTSRQAAVFNFPRSKSQRHAVLMEIAASGPWGRNFDELIVNLEMYSAQKRLHDLKIGGWVKSTGRTRPTRTGAAAEVYVLTEKAQKWIAEKGKQHA